MIIAGFILLAVGMAAVTLFFYRSKSHDLTLIYFSLFDPLCVTASSPNAGRSFSLRCYRLSRGSHQSMDYLYPFNPLPPVSAPDPRTADQDRRKSTADCAGDFGGGSDYGGLFGVGESFAFSVNNYLVLAIIGGLTVNLIILRSRGLGQLWTGEYALSLSVLQSLVLLSARQSR